MKTIVFLVGASVGYVLGSRAGRRRYDQIKDAAVTAWRSDAVQTGVAAAQRGLDNATPVVQQAAKRFVGYVGEGTQQLADQADGLQTRVTHSTDELKRRSEELRRRGEEQIEEVRRRVEEEVERSRDASAESLRKVGDLRDEALLDLEDDADEMLEPGSGAGR